MKFSTLLCWVFVVRTSISILLDTDRITEMINLSESEAFNMSAEKKEIEVFNSGHAQTGLVSLTSSTI